jgi:quinol monooxygenase YgiN
MVADVGWIYTFWADPEHDDEIVAIMGEIFDAMEEEEFPTGNVLTYTLYRAPEEPGKWVMFEHFTGEGSDLHAKGPRVREIGLRKLDLMTKPYTRMRMEPVMIRGCGEPINSERASEE